MDQWLIMQFVCSVRNQQVSQMEQQQQKNVCTNANDDDDDGGLNIVWPLNDKFSITAIENTDIWKKLIHEKACWPKTCWNKICEKKNIICHWIVAISLQNERKQFKDNYNDEMKESMGKKRTKKRERKSLNECDSFFYLSKKSIIVIIIISGTRQYFFVCLFELNIWNILNNKYILVKLTLKSIFFSFSLSLSFYMMI